MTKRETEAATDLAKTLRQIKAQQHINKLELHRILARLALVETEQEARTPSCATSSATCWSPYTRRGLAMSDHTQYSEPEQPWTEAELVLCGGEHSKRDLARLILRLEDERDELRQRCEELEKAQAVLDAVFACLGAQGLTAEQIVRTLDTHKEAWRKARGQDPEPQKGNQKA